MPDATAPTAEQLFPPPAHVINGRESVGLDKRGSMPTEHGRVVRPTRDLEADPTPKQQRDATLTPAEHESIHANSRPLARLTSRAAEIAAELPAAITDRAKLAALRDEAEALERDRTGDARAAARIACLTAVEAAATRAALDYINAANILAETAAKYEAAVQLIDRLTGLNRWDGLGCWRRDGKVLAPEQRHRPRSLRIVSSSWSADALWAADSQQHLHAVEAGIARLRAELQHGLNGSGWPF